MTNETKDKLQLYGMIVGGLCALALTTALAFYKCIQHDTMAIETQAVQLGYAEMKDYGTHKVWQWKDIRDIKIDNARKE